MKKNSKYNILIMIILCIGLGAGILGYFGFMEFIKHFPMNG